MKSILFEQDQAIAKITLNRPEKYNAFNREMAFRLQDLLQECQQNEGIRCVVIAGHGKAFSAGQDLEEAIDPDGPELTKIISEHYNPLITLIRNLRKPVIAAVNGVAAGAGANIAVACDVVLAASSATFFQAFSKIGLIPDSGGTFFLPRLIGFQKASALMLLGDKVTASEAEKLGLIYKVIEDENFEMEVQKIAQKLSKMPTYGLWLTKQALNQSFNHTLHEQLNLEDELQTKAGHSYDYNEGVTAFLEKRKPVFKGQ